MDMAWLLAGHQLTIGYGLAIGWVWAGYGLAMGWLWAGYLLACHGLVMVIYRLAIDYL